jgi:hypothetical protein
MPPDPGLEREDSSGHQGGDMAYVKKAMQKPNCFIRMKAAVGGLLLLPVQDSH